MATPKAHFRGNGEGILVRQFSDKLKSSLRSFYPNEEVDPDPAWGDPADNFVASVLSEGEWLASELHWMKFETTTGGIRSEKTRLLNSLGKSVELLTNISPDFEYLLPIEVDILGYADTFKELIHHFECTEKEIEALPKSDKPSSKEKIIAIEATVRTLRVLAEHGIPPSETVHTEFEATSDAIKILKAIGDDIGFVRTPSVWKKNISAAKKIAPDLAKYGNPPSDTTNTDIDTATDSTKTLKAIDTNIGLVRATIIWCKNLNEARKAALDLAEYETP